MDSIASSVPSPPTEGTDGKLQVPIRSKQNRHQTIFLVAFVSLQCVLNGIWGLGVASITEVRFHYANETSGLDAWFLSIFFVSYLVFAPLATWMQPWNALWMGVLLTWISAVTRTWLFAPLAGTPLDGIGCMAPDTGSAIGYLVSAIYLGAADAFLCPYIVKIVQATTPAKRHGVMTGIVNVAGGAGFSIFYSLGSKLVALPLRMSGNEGDASANPSNTTSTTAIDRETDTRLGNCVSLYWMYCTLAVLVLPIGIVFVTARIYWKLGLDPLPADNSDTNPIPDEHNGSRGGDVENKIDVASPSAEGMVVAVPVDNIPLIEIHPQTRLLLWTYVACNAIAGAMITFVTINLDLLCLVKSMSPTQISLASSLYLFPGVLISPILLGWLADRTHRWATLIWVVTFQHLLSQMLFLALPWNFVNMVVLTWHGLVTTYVSLYTAYFAELCYPASADRYVNALYTSWTIAAFLASFIPLTPESMVANYDAIAAISVVILLLVFAVLSMATFCCGRPRLRRFVVASVQAH